MKRETYQRGLPGVKWGIWNCQRKCFQFSICEDTPMLAEARLHQKIGDDARKWRFEPRQLPGKYATFSSVFAPIFMFKNRICRNDHQTIAGTIFPSC